MMQATPLFNYQEKEGNENKPLDLPNPDK